jgi:hypothetical protein
MASNLEVLWSHSSLLTRHSWWCSNLLGQEHQDRLWYLHCYICHQTSNYTIIQAFILLLLLRSSFKPPCSNIMILSIVNIVPRKSSVLEHLYDWIPSFLMIFSMVIQIRTQRERERESPWSWSLSQSLDARARAQWCSSTCLCAACHYSRLKTLQLKTMIIQQNFWIFLVI